MQQQYLLGIDIGTSGCKLTVFDRDGQVIANKTQGYPTYYPASDAAEQDAEDWWTAVCQGLSAIFANGSVSVGAIAGVGVAGHSWACLPLDRDGQPLQRAMIWLDRRAQRQAQEMENVFGAELLLEMAGNPVDAAYIAPKMMWLRQQRPEVYRQVQVFLQSNSYIVYKLTGQYSQDYSQGYGFHFFDMENGCFNPEAARELGLSAKQIPPLVPCHHQVGQVSKAAAKLTGLLEGTPVVAGGLDAACCTLGAGVICPGQTQEQGGQAGGMSIVLERPLRHRKLILGYHVIPQAWLLQGGTVGGGSSLKWFHDQLGDYFQQQGAIQGKSPFELMSEAAAEVELGSDGLVFLPYMAGERSPIWNSRARGVLFGLGFDKSRAHIVRSIMEGVGYSLRHNVETAEEAGAKIDELVSVGGAANSQVWTQLKSDIIGKPMNVPLSDHATTLGAAMLAGVGVGVYQDFPDAVAKTVQVQRRHEPRAPCHQLYSRYYSLYRRLYRQLEDCYDELFEIIHHQQELKNKAGI